MKQLKEFLQVFRQGAKLTNKSQTHIIYTVASLMLAATSFAMFALNIKREFYVMAAITAILAVLLLFCAYLSGVRKMEILPSAIMAAGLIFIFSYFAVSGQNEGFAILWILLVPLFSPSIMDMRIGIGLSAYFLIFSLLLFYTPLKVYVTGDYTASFMERFPVLYLCDFMISMFLSLQKEFYSRKLHLKSNMDELTGVYNRSYFTHFILHAPLPDKTNTCVMLIDLNGLKEVNDMFGHEAGDELICAVPYCCRKVIKSGFTLCRIGGDEFVLVTHRPEEEIAVLAEKLKEQGQKWHGKYSKGCQMAIGWASSSAYPGDTAIALYKTADTMMYQDKAAYYQEKGIDRRNRSGSPAAAEAT